MRGFQGFRKDRDGKEAEWQRKAERLAEYLVGCFTNDMRSSIETKVQESINQADADVSIEDLRSLLKDESSKKGSGTRWHLGPCIEAAPREPALSDLSIDQLLAMVRNLPGLLEISCCSAASQRRQGPDRLENLRPISLLNSMAKLEETFLQRDIEETTEALWEPRQFGFQPRICAVQQAGKLVEEVRRILKSRDLCS